MKRRREILTFSLAAVMSLCLTGCQASGGETAWDLNKNLYQEGEIAVTEQERASGNPIFVMTLKDGGELRGELYPDVAPQSVGNFIALANSGFYDGLIFHRVIPGFMIQGGCPNGTGMGGPGYSIKGEFAQNGFANDLAHDRGVLSMARAMDPDSAGSQFFIMVDKAPHLDGGYAAFGKVIEGMETADAIVSGKTDWQDRPRQKQVMKKVTVDTFGVEYPEPEKI